MYLLLWSIFRPERNGQNIDSISRMGKSIFIFRYDNATHHKEISTFPHHKHVGIEVKPSREMGLAEVVSEIESTILTKI